MANFFYRSQFNFSNSAKTVTLRATLNFGAAGAVTVASGTGMGIASVVKQAAAGTYKITLDRAFNSLMAFHRTTVRTDGSAPAAPSSYLSDVSVSNSAAPSITMVLNSAGTATNPASGESALIEIILNDSSLGY